jgi:NAD(P)-dependent dehydrogenase (short-subunit alcohol dehydrogenase family)
VELSGKVALVTGSSPGIGREIARAREERRAGGGPLPQRREAAQETLASLEGGAHAAFAADVADAGSARGLVEDVAREMGAPSGASPTQRRSRVRWCSWPRRLQNP